tara:strand:- start:6705 stop:7970 length:1266 start_codon:yes stop_codon:yes gene_type:complete
MSFLQGFVTGFSRSADSAIKSYLESDNQLKNRLAEKRIARGETEEARFQKDFREYKRDIKGLAKKAGGTDNVQYILQEFGYDEGKRIINDLYTKQINGGKSISDLFSLNQRTGPSVTIDQLATFYTPPVKIGSGASMKGAGGGFTRMFGGEDYIQKAVLKETDAVVGKLTKSSLSEIPETLTAIDALENYEIGYSLDYKKEYSRLMNVANNFINKGEIEKAAKIRIAAEANFLTMQNFEKDEYSAAELKAVGKDFTKQLVNVHQVKGKYALDGTFITPAESVDAYKTVEGISADLQSVSSSARKNYNLDPSYIKLKMTEAISKNLMPVIVPASDAFSKAIIKLTDEPMFIKTTKQGTTTISGGGLSQTYGMANIPSQIDKIKKLTGNSRELAVIDAQKLFGADQNVLNELNKQLRANGLLK